MRTEQHLRAALHTIAEQTPDADLVVARVQLPASTPGLSRRRPVLVAASLAVMLVLVAAIVLPSLTRRSALEPADRRIAGNWTMVSDVKPPPGWSRASREISGTYETTTLSDPPSGVTAGSRSPGVGWLRK